MKSRKLPLSSSESLAELNAKTFKNSAIHVEIFEENYHHANILGIAVVNER